MLLAKASPPRTGTSSRRCSTTANCRARPLPGRLRPLLPAGVLVEPRPLGRGSDVPQVRALPRGQVGQPRGETTYSTTRSPRPSTRSRTSTRRPGKRRRKGASSDSDPHGSPSGWSPTRCRSSRSSTGATTSFYAETHWEPAIDFKPEILVREVKAEMDRCTVRGDGGMAPRIRAAYEMAKRNGEDGDRPGPPPKAIRVTRTLVSDVERALDRSMPWAGPTSRRSGVNPRKMTPTRSRSCPCGTDYSTSPGRRAPSCCRDESLLLAFYLPVRV